MARPEIFDIPRAGLVPASYLAEVVAVDAAGQVPRVQVRLLSFDGPATQDGPLWARVAVPYAGDNRGAFLLPNVGDEVLVTFLNGDARFPVVIGGLWNGGDRAPERLGGAGDAVDRWSLVGTAGTRIAIVEERAGQPTISFSTPGNVSGTLTDRGGGTLELAVPGTTLTLTPSGVRVQTQGTVTVQASQVQITAGQVTVNAAVSTFSGLVKCDVLKATTIIAETYTPGAGNVW
jgi:uncharacterized protein involved in type VI secretion and phage assembly